MSVKTQVDENENVKKEIQEIKHSKIKEVNIKQDNIKQDIKQDIKQVKIKLSKPSNLVIVIEGKLFELDLVFTSWPS